jgi:hypothetical protein
LQANVYTYLNVTEDGKDQWIAVTKIDAQVGETYYFDEYMEMLLFESKDLGRTFESVYFVQDLRKTLGESTSSSKCKCRKGICQLEFMMVNLKVWSGLKIDVEPIEGGITIAELFANREKYRRKKGCYSWKSC